MCPEIYFRATGNIVLNIQTFTLILRRAYCALLCRIGPRAAYQLSGTERSLRGWMPGCCRYGPRGPPRAAALRTGGGRRPGPPGESEAEIMSGAVEGRVPANVCRAGYPGD
jgi:hypothetical protein